MSVTGLTTAGTKRQASASSDITSPRLGTDEFLDILTRSFAAPPPRVSSLTSLTATPGSQKASEPPRTLTKKTARNDRTNEKPAGKSSSRTMLRKSRRSTSANDHFTTAPSPTAQTLATSNSASRSETPQRLPLQNDNKNEKSQQAQKTSRQEKALLDPPLPEQYSWETAAGMPISILPSGSGETQGPAVEISSLQDPLPITSLSEGEDRPLSDLFTPVVKKTGPLILPQEEDPPLQTVPGGPSLAIRTRGNDETPPSTFSSPASPSPEQTKTDQAFNPSTLKTMPQQATSQPVPQTKIQIPEIQVTQTQVTQAQALADLLEDGVNAFIKVETQPRLQTAQPGQPEPSPPSSGDTPPAPDPLLSGQDDFKSGKESQDTFPHDTQKPDTQTPKDSPAQQDLTHQEKDRANPGKEGQQPDQERTPTAQNKEQGQSQPTPQPTPTSSAPNNPVTPLSEGSHEATAPGGMTSPGVKPAPDLSSPATTASLSGPSAETHTPRTLPPLPSRPHQTVRPEHLIEQIKVKITQGGVKGGDKISVQLYPEDLGRVEIRLEVRDSRVAAHVIADAAETLNALKADARSLEKALNDVGLKSDAGSLQFSLRGDGGQQQHTTHQSDRGPNNPYTSVSQSLEDDLIPSLDALQTARAANRGGVDIRV